MNYSKIVNDRVKRAGVIAAAGGLDQAISSGALARRADVTLSEAIILGLLRQEVAKYIGIFGHGSTEIAEVLRVYEAAGLVKTYNVRNEVEASHAAVALRWVRGEKAAVITSIGPGALQALAGSLVSASDGVGVWYLFGDETTEDEGPNMQQIPKNRQHSFFDLCQTMGQAYSLETPLSVTTALRRGLNTVDHPYLAGPFYLLMPMNTQCSVLKNFNLEQLPVEVPPKPGAAIDDGRYEEAAEALLAAERVVVRVGGGARYAGPAIDQFLELVDGAAVTSPLVSGVIAYNNPRNMTVGGSKGSLSGNYAMDQSDLLVAVGTRFVCQSDSSRTGYPRAGRVININADIEAATHYNRATSFVGDISATLEKLNEELRKQSAKAASKSDWADECTQKKAEWEAFKQARYDSPCLHDEVWGREVLTQPAAIKAATDWARQNDAISFFDSGDVQANGFQIVEDDRLGRTFTETGASYMGFSASAIMAAAMADDKFYAVAMCGDGSFIMNPQVLIDGVQHRAAGCIIVFDNRRMAAISGLQDAQYGADYATNDSVEIDYVALAKAVKGVKALHGGYSTVELVNALDEARSYQGLSLIHVPVYYGDNPLGGMGVFGRWNVGNWCEEVQALRHEIGL